MPKAKVNSERRVAELALQLGKRGGDESGLLFLGVRAFGDADLQQGRGLCHGRTADVPARGGQVVDDHGRHLAAFAQ